MDTSGRLLLLITSNGLQYKGLQIVKEGGLVTKMYSIYNDSLVGRRVLLKDLSRLASVVQDGSLTVTPFLAVRTDNEPNFIRVVSLQDVVIIGEVQR
jgi:hypothetical protein